MEKERKMTVAGYSLLLNRTLLKTKQLIFLFMEEKTMYNIVG